MDEEKKEDCPLCQVSEDTIKNLENAKPTKKAKYFLRKEKKEQDRLTETRKKKNRKIIKVFAISLIAVLVVGGIALGINKSVKNRNFGDPRVEIVSLEYDAGTVSMADGLVRHTYEIKNVGEGDLKIKKIRTSCMCTTARLKIGDDLSPEFGMHDSFPWSERIAPGETGYLEVVFDPSFHGPAGTGLVTRAIYVPTDDPENKNIEFILTANVVK